LNKGFSLKDARETRLISTAEQYSMFRISCQHQKISAFPENKSFRLLDDSQIYFRDMTKNLLKTLPQVEKAL
jgi:hypothetical protein